MRLKPSLAKDIADLRGIVMDAILLIKDEAATRDDQIAEVRAQAQAILVEINRVNNGEEARNAAKKVEVSLHSRIKESENHMMATTSAWENTLASHTTSLGALWEAITDIQEALDEDD